MNGSKFWSSPFTRLTIYYVVVAVVAYGVFMVFPSVADMFSGERLRELAQGGGGF